MEIEKININEHTKDELEFLQHISKAVEAIHGVKKVSVNFLINKCKFGRELFNDASINFK